MFNDKIEPIIIGSLKITDKKTGEVLVKKRNAIHQGNMAYIIASALAGEPTSVNPEGGMPYINWMAFGNGGSTSTTTLSYKSPNVSTIYDQQPMSASLAKLYSKTYEQQVNKEVFFPGQSLGNDEYIPASTSKIKFSLDIDHDAVSVATGQTTPENDSSTDAAAVEAFTFDEIGLVAGVTDAGSLDESKSLLITHVTFHPVLLSANRTISIEYTITIQLG
jgi:hypothetical protein